MRIKIKDFFQKYSLLFGLFAGALISWVFGWVLPSKDVTANNIPQKELTCTLDYSYPMIARKTSDNRLQLLYDGHTVNAPYAFGITITNTGAYAITNDDFSDFFSIDFSGSNQLVYAQVVKPSNGAITEEVLSNAKIDGTTLTITDFYLNLEESFGIYLIVDGKPDVINYHSRISDISELSLRNKPKEKKDNSIKFAIRALVIVMVTFAIFIVCEVVRAKKWKKREDELLRKCIETQQDSLPEQTTVHSSTHTDIDGQHTQ